jgi:hypothetical protein
VFNIGKVVKVGLDSSVAIENEERFTNIQSYDKVAFLSCGSRVFLYKNEGLLK